MASSTTGCQAWCLNRFFSDGGGVHGPVTLSPASRRPKASVPSPHGSHSCPVRRISAWIPILPPFLTWGKFLCLESVFLICKMTITIRLRNAVVESEKLPNISSFTSSALQVATFVDQGSCAESDCDPDVMPALNSRTDQLRERLTQARRSQQGRFTANLSVRIFVSCVNGCVRYKKMYFF